MLKGNVHARMIIRMEYFVSEKSILLISDEKKIKTKTIGIIKYKLIIRNFFNK